MATALQSRMSEVLAVDIHPAARFGRGVVLGHGTGVVVGETAAIGDNVSLLQNVTLGGTGKEVGDRHPKISDNVLIGANATVLGNIVVGRGSQIAAGSVVLKPVPPATMVAGSPARVVGQIVGFNPAREMRQWGREFDSGSEEGGAAGGGADGRADEEAADAMFADGRSDGGNSGSGGSGGGGSGDDDGTDEHIDRFDWAI
jgi:serine O-acetyltransferase